MNNSTLPKPRKGTLWRNPFGRAFIAFYLAMAVVGLLVPDDILESNAWAREFSDPRSQRNG